MASDASIVFGTTPDDQRERMRAIKLTATASLIGTTIEWYDFILYTSLAGIVFNKLYFPADDAVVSLLLAYATFAVGFLTRPIGGAFFGHFGDRIGRKPLLVLTLTMMGGATFLIGLVPTYAAIGVTAPIVMIILRLTQGFAMGGEWGGAVLMAFEYAPPGRRGFYASFPQIGFAIGLCLSTGAITLLSSVLSNEAFLAWGWRCAFYVSILLLAVGLFVRLKLFETPEFVRARENYHVTKLPIGELARKYWWNVILGWLARMGEGGIFTVFTLYMLSYLTAIVHLPRTLVLSSVTAAALAIVIAIGVLWAPVYGPEAALFCELFDTPVRYTGVSLVYQFGSIIFLAPVPILATLLVAWNGNQPWYLATYLLLACIVSAAATALMRRTYT